MRNFVSAMPKMYNKLFEKGIRHGELWRLE